MNGWDESFEECVDGGIQSYFVSDGMSSIFLIMKLKNIDFI